MTERRIYDTPAWKAVRKAAKERDGNRCTWCGGTKDLQVDHIIPLAAGGPPYDMGNVRTLCQPCHSTREPKWRAIAKQVSTASEGYTTSRDW